MCTIVDYEESIAHVCKVDRNMGCGVLTGMEDISDSVVKFSEMVSSVAAGQNDRHCARLLLPIHSQRLNTELSETFFENVSDCKE